MEIVRDLFLERHTPCLGVFEMNDFISKTPARRAEAISQRDAQKITDILFCFIFLRHAAGGVSFLK